VGSHPPSPSAGAWPWAGDNMPFVLFMDESGDHNLVSIDRNFPIFCLAGCVFERRYYQEIARRQVDEFKLHFWGRTDVILSPVEFVSTREISLF
jgi:hypothetical protein